MAPGEEATTSAEHRQNRMGVAEVIPVGVEAQQEVPDGGLEVTRGGQNRRRRWCSGAGVREGWNLGEHEHQGIEGNSLERLMAIGSGRGGLAM